MKFNVIAKSNMSALRKVRMLKTYVPTGVMLINKNKMIWCVTCRKRK